MDDKQKSMLINSMADNLPVLRKKLGMSQEDLAKLIGVSRSTIASIENKKREMTWNHFLSLVLVFTKNQDTDVLLKAFNIYTNELEEFIRVSR